MEQPLPLYLQFLDQVQLSQGDLFSIKLEKTEIVNIPSMKSLSSMSVQQDRLLVLNKLTGSIVVYDRKAQKIEDIKHYQSQVSYISGDGNHVGTNEGAVYEIDQDARLGQLVSQGEGAVKWSDGQNILYDNGNIKSDQGKFQVPSEDRVSQIVFKDEEKIFINTVNHKGYAWNIHLNETTCFQNPADTVKSEFTGVFYNKQSGKIILTQPNSKLQHINPDTLKVDFATQYKSKKETDLLFGHLFSMNEGKSLISVHPNNSLVIIDTVTNKLVAYEAIKFQSAIYSINFEKREIYILSQANENTNLTLQTYRILNLKENLIDSLTGSKQRIKSSIKLVLQYKCLQSLELMQPIFTQTEFTAIKQDEKFTKEIQAFQQLYDDILKVSIVPPEPLNITVWNNDDEDFPLLQDQSSNTTSIIVSAKKPDSISELLMKEKLKIIERKKKRDEEKLARKIYRENKKINRELKVNAYLKWFRGVFLGNLVRWTYWLDKPKLIQVINELKTVNTDIMVRQIMRDNTFIKLLNGIRRHNYTEFPFAKAMLQYKYTVEYQTLGLFLLQNGNLCSEFQIANYITRFIKQTLITLKVPLKLKLKLPLSEIEQKLILIIIIQNLKVQFIESIV